MAPQFIQTQITIQLDFHPKSDNIVLVKKDLVSNFLLNTTKKRIRQLILKSNHSNVSHYNEHIVINSDY